MSNYILTVGLEIHMQLETQSKAYCADPNRYGDEPNVNISAVSLGHPGTLPVVNTESLEIAIRLGLAVGAEIRSDNQFARKNYFYADLSKGYQITQHTTPICTGGKVDFVVDGVNKSINLTRVHLEEDAGKSMHDQDVYDSLVDYNRCGVPLLEMVTEPEFTSSAEAYAFLQEVRRLVRHLDICDGNMEEGSLRCDVNISVRPEGQTLLGTKVEIKNLNSFKNVIKAIESEYLRQTEDLMAGKSIDSETRNFDAIKETTTALRSKEMANDYRYFPEPDLPRILVDKEWVESTKGNMPEMIAAKQLRYQTAYGLSEYDSRQIAEQKSLSKFYEKIIVHTTNYKAAANWLLGPIKSTLNKEAIEIEHLSITPQQVALLVMLVDSGKLSFSVASQKLYHDLLETPNDDVEAFAINLGLIKEQDSSLEENTIREIFSDYPEKLAEYKGGKKGIAGFFVGEAMKRLKGKSDPKNVSLAINRLLEAKE